jgi:hypothetical protein
VHALAQGVTVLLVPLVLALHVNFAAAACATEHQESAKPTSTVFTRLIEIGEAVLQDVWTPISSGAASALSWKTLWYFGKATIPSVTSDLKIMGVPDASASRLANALTPRFQSPVFAGVAVVSGSKTARAFFEPRQANDALRLSPYRRTRGSSRPPYRLSPVPNYTPPDCLDLIHI